MLPVKDSEMFSGQRVAAFESRMAFEMTQLIRNFGGAPFVAPSMREVPLEANSSAFEFADRLLAGKIDVVVLLTGVGTRTLVQVLEKRIPRDKMVGALSKATLIARGPKPIAALRELGLTPAIAAPEPNTWREILAEVDRGTNLNGKKVAVQEYGLPNSDLLDELKKRGAHVMRVPVYRWALPEDCSALREVVSKICENEMDVALFTNAAQVEHLLQVAAEDGLEESLRESLESVVIASIGPVTSDALRERGLSIDLQAERGKIGLFVREVAQKCVPLVEAKRRGAAERDQWLESRPVRRPLVQDAALWKDSPFMKACRCEAAPTTPIWIMRQAGRYMKEYREMRRRVKFLELCKTPDLAAEVTIQAVEKLGVDAAIIFSDILLIVEPMGVGLEFARGEGPVIHRPVRTSEDVDAIREFSPAKEMVFVCEAVKKARSGLHPHIPLIGFAGAPFTVVSYLIEGKASRDYLHTKSLMYRDPGAWNALMGKVTEATGAYVNAQIEAGAQVVQIFDSWVGCLSPDDYREYILPHMKRLMARITAAPVIHFGTGTAALLELMRDAGGQVIGLDWRVRLDDGWKRVGPIGVQGNLDPLVLLADRETIRKKTKEVMRQAGGRPGHIFNLGHGVLPQTPVDNVRALVDMVHEMGRSQ
ncbi:MAG: uroporphyrinogen decarboxylase [Nitrospirae bacterium]|nr:uroporphyrinogen decarboxylase [Nitrospirota bacterium]